VKGIILAGGTGSRLWPITRGSSKQLLPIYDKPMIFYPLSTLMMAGLRDVLVITTPEDQDAFQRLLGDGSEYGVRLSYAVQPKPEGLAQAFLIAEDFLAGDSAALALGDNIFHGQGLGRKLRDCTSVEGGHIFAYRVANPQDYGVVTFDEDGTATALEEKPARPTSPFAVPGLYFYGADVVDVAKTITPSARGELEITAVNEWYLRRGRLQVTLLERGTTWLDTGSFQTLHDAGDYVRVVQQRQGIMIGCLEEIAWRNGWISDTAIKEAALRLAKSGYGEYLASLVTSG
jgi:glucose-1-phosphate thymidylyltransferase